MNHFLNIISYIGTYSFVPSRIIKAIGGDNRTLREFQWTYKKKTERRSEMR